jgi:hypothetical protein
MSPNLTQRPTALHVRTSPTRARLATRQTDDIVTPGVYRNPVAGAPFGIGESVSIRGRLDDDTFDSRFSQRRGTVTALVYDSPGSQFPTAPMVMVHVDGLGEDVFFIEELYGA